MCAEQEVLLPAAFLHFPSSRFDALLQGAARGAVKLVVHLASHYPMRLTHTPAVASKFRTKKESPDMDLSGLAIKAELLTGNVIRALSGFHDDSVGLGAMSFVAEEHVADYLDVYCVRLEFEAAVVCDYGMYNANWIPVHVTPTFVNGDIRIPGVVGGGDEFEPGTGVEGGLP